MRMMLRATMPVEKGNEMIRSGELQETIESVIQQLEPEAVYFYEEDGTRAALYVFDMEGSWQIPAMVEPLFQKLNASVRLTPVMNAEDLQRGLEEAGV